jgi:hypothetical protein
MAGASRTLIAVPVLSVLAKSSRRLPTRAQPSPSTASWLHPLAEPLLPRAVRSGQSNASSRAISAVLISMSRELTTGLGRDPDVATHDDRLALLGDDHQLRPHPRPRQLRSRAGEQRPVLDRRVREPDDEGRQIRLSLFDPVARN